MPRFSITQLLMGTALIAILLVLTQAEGCGTRFSMIETLSFSSDGSRILVTKLTARDAQTPMKLYKSNVARTISWLDSSSGLDRGVIHQDFKPGNSGPAFRHWWVGRTSVICDPSNDRIAFSAFGGGDVTYGVDQASPVTIPLTQPAANLAISKSGRFLAASGMFQLTVTDTSTSKTLLQAQAGALPFLGALLMSFNGDESRLITVGDSVHIWDITTASQPTTLQTDTESLVRAIALLPDDSLVLCSNSWIKRYDLSGKLLTTIDDHGGYVCVASQTRGTVVISNGDTVTVCDATNGTIKQTLPLSGAISLALSPNDELLAIGDYNGRVALYNLPNGDRQWLANAPGRHRWPWPIPAAALCAWCWIAWRLASRGTHVGQQSS